MVISTSRAIILLLCEFHIYTELDEVPVTDKVGMLSNHDYVSQCAATALHGYGI